MKGFLKRLAGADRPSVIAVFAETRVEALSCVVHAQTSGTELPIWVWCAEAASDAAGSARFRSGVTASVARRELRQVWPALSIVCWSGTRGPVGLKLLPFVVPPFRIVVRNEVGDFFGVLSGTLVSHLTRRARDTSVSVATRLGEWAVAIVQLAVAVVLRIWRFLARHGDWLKGATLAVLAWIAPPFWPLAYAAIGKPRPVRHLFMHLGAPPNTRTVELRVGDRRWRRSQIQKAVEESDASFLVFRQPSCTEAVEPLLELARITGAFAVARQSAYTGWRRQVTNRHPFRVLQNGEMASVLSPMSPLLVMRRDAVAALGLPEAFTFGAAMAALFRRAASAGLESLTAGGSEPLTQEPAMALEDLEFTLRLDSVTPQNPELRRGNIATASSGSAGFRGKPRILVVSPYLPFPLSHGGAVRIYNLCRELSGEVDFILACFREANERVCYEELHQVFREVYVVDIDERETDAKVPRQVAEYRNSAMRSLIHKLCRERGIDLVQLEYTQMAEYRACAGETPVVLVEHDITFSLYRQLAENSGTSSDHRQFHVWQQFEREALSRMSGVWTMSAADRLLAMENGAAETVTAVVPNGVDLSRFRPEKKTTDAPVILFVGSFRHLPNLLAFEVLRNSIFPEVRKSIPEARLHVIAGPDHERSARTSGKHALLSPVPGITIDGFVADLRPVYRECSVVVIPLPVSAGTNIKLMEAMACGRAVVSTPTGCAGLELNDGEDLLIRDLGGAFAQAIAGLLSDGEKRSAIQFHARETAERRFGWGAIAHAAIASYEQMLGRELLVADTLVRSQPVSE